MEVYSATEECRRMRAPEGRRWAETSFGGAGGLKDRENKGDHEEMRVEG